MTGILGEHAKVCTPLHLEESVDSAQERGDHWNVARADSKLERKTVMKLNLLLVPLMCGLYLLALLGFKHTWVIQTTNTRSVCRQVVRREEPDKLGEESNRC